ncbi:MAG: hypothetical protein NTY13_05100 [Chlamydiae bacterium]|nr:hypothetical protein [Chlamydiota bacterium]
MIISLFKRIFIKRWQRKILALIIAIIAWSLMHQAITITRIISDIPVKVIHLPPNKTIEGLLPSGYLDTKLTLTIVGSRSALEKLSASDLEILVDAEGKGDEWIVHADKSSLVSKNAALDIRSSIKDIVQNEFVLSLTPLITDQVPIIILKPIGRPPAGYQFLDIWPQFLTQTISGPQKEVQKLKVKGIKLVFDLGLIESRNLMKISSADSENQEEISFYVPESWKKVVIPFLGNTEISLNSPDSASLRINFLKRTFLSLDTLIPISLYFPFETVNFLNSEKIKIENSPLINKSNGTFFLKEPLYAKDVSSLFLDVVRNHLELVIIASNKDYLEWSINFLNFKGLEKSYIALALAEYPENHALELTLHLKQEQLQSRFRTYVDQFRLYTSQKKPFKINPILKDQQILIQ